MSTPIYTVGENRHLNRKMKYKRRIKLVSFLLVIIIVSIAIFWFFYLRQYKGTRPQIGPAFTTTIAGPTVYKSKYFEFSDTAKWVYAPNDSTANETTFLQYHGGVLADSISVYVNQLPSIEELPATYVLPVQIKNQNSFIVSQISSQCSSVYLSTDKKLTKKVLIDGTNMICYPDSPEYHVIAGQIGGDYNLTLKRSNNQLAKYIIIYKDLSTSPQDLPFVNFLATFKAL